MVDVAAVCFCCFWNSQVVANVVVVVVAAALEVEVSYFGDVIVAIFVVLGDVDVAAIVVGVAFVVLQLLLLQLLILLFVLALLEC